MNINMFELAINENQKLSPRDRILASIPENLKKHFIHCLDVEADSNSLWQIFGYQPSIYQKIINYRDTQYSLILSQKKIKTLTLKEKKIFALSMLSALSFKVIRTDNTVKPINPLKLKPSEAQHMTDSQKSLSPTKKGLKILPDSYTTPLEYTSLNHRDALRILTLKKNAQKFPTPAPLLHHYTAIQYSPMRAGTSDLLTIDDENGNQIVPTRFKI